MSRIYRITVGEFNVDPPEDFDWGIPGNRPAVTTRPTASTTGARYDVMQTMTGPQAITAILNSPVEEDGARYLRRVKINSNLAVPINLGSNHLIFEDCVVDVREANPLYAITAFQSLGDPEPLFWPEFRSCEIMGGSVSSFRGGYVRLLKCNMYHGDDILKPWNGMEVWASYLHSAWKAPESHCDIIQIRGGCSGALFHYNNFVGFTDPASPAGLDWTSGVTQTGTITADIGVPEPVRFTGNWVEGGRYGYRGSGGGNNPNGNEVHQIYRNNRFIRGSFQYGPYYQFVDGSEDLDESNVWDDNDQPITGGG